jgi:hypothetical protein
LSPQTPTKHQKGDDDDDAMADGSVDKHDGAASINSGGSGFVVSRRTTEVYASSKTTRGGKGKGGHSASLGNLREDEELIPTRRTTPPTESSYQRTPTKTELHALANDTLDAEAAEDATGYKGTGHEKSCIIISFVLYGMTYALPSLLPFIVENYIEQNTTNCTDNSGGAVLSFIFRQRWCCSANDG